MHETTLQRLAFAKYLFSLGIEQSKAPEIFAATSVLTFHDAIELFLQIASEHLGAGQHQPNFMDYWEFLPKRLNGAELPQKESIRRLNKARVALKHSGTLPSKLDIESFRFSTSSFFEEATKLIFDKEFSDISLVEYVTPVVSRDHLKKASELMGLSKFDDALDEIALAYESMIDDYENRKRGFFGHSPFFFGKSFAFHSSFSMGVNDGELRKLGRFIDDVKDSISSMQRAIKILALGLDYKKYTKFKMYMPVVHKFADGHYQIERLSWADQPKANKDVVDFCINFVILSSIKLNEFDYSID